MSNPFNGCPLPPGPGCPYQAEDGYNDRNRYPQGHLFVGEIEDGKRYPFGVYTKEEADERFAGKYVEDEIIDIKRRLDALEHNEMAIETFTATPASAEYGTSNTVTLNWKLSKVPITQSINGEEVTGTSKQYTGVVQDTTYTLTASDGQNTVTKSVTVSFANYIYYGAAANLNNVTSLTKTLSNKKTRTITVDAGAGEYIIYALPIRLGEVVFYVSNFEGGFEPAEEMILTNSGGYQEPYYVYRSTRANLGLTEVEVKEE